MSNGPLGPGECVDAGIKGISDLFASTSELYNTNQFVNPQLINIINMGQAADGAQQRAAVYKAYLNTIVPPPPNLAQLIAEAEHFEQVLTDYDYAVQQYQIWCNFLSGKSPQFPLGGPAGLNTGFLFGEYDENGEWQPGPDPAFLGLLAGMGFVGLWGFAKGANQSAYVKCEVDPEAPCAGVNKVLGAIIGAFNTVINTMINGLNAMIDLVANIADYIAQAIGFVEDLVAIIANAIAELCQQLVTALRDGLARMLDGLKLDPCLGAVLNTCCGNDLKASLGLPIV